MEGAAQLVDADSDRRYLTAAEAARMLGVKPATVYAYVSRGVLERAAGSDRRRSLFDRSVIEALAERNRRGGHEPEEAVETHLTLLRDDTLYYRGLDATELARQHPFESVATLLWTGRIGTRADTFTAPPRTVDSVRAAVAALGADARLSDRLRVAVVAAGANDPLRVDLSREATMRAARTLLAACVDALTPTSSATGSLARRLWPALTDRPWQPGLLDPALILLADHDLAVSTVAARVAASARANPYAVVSAGLGALDGLYHGAASTLAHQFLADAIADPIGAVYDRLRTGAELPGFGHPIYRRSDPRAEALFRSMRALPTAAPALAAIDAIVERLRPQRPAVPNVDLALAALMHATGMRRDAGEAVFAVARTAGWTAHALEEYAQPALRFRAVGTYLGPEPTATIGTE